MNIKLQTLSLTRYNEQEHKNLKEELDSGNSSSNYIHQIGERLENSKDNDRMIYQSAFVAVDGEIPIGYLFISSNVNDVVFLEYAVLKEFRRRGCARRIVSEVSEYLFEKHNVSSIRLDIDPSNEGSMMVANACGYMLDEEEYESRNYIGKMQFVRDSTCYVSKRRK